MNDSHRRFSIKNIAYCAALFVCISLFLSTVVDGSVANFGPKQSSESKKLAKKSKRSKSKHKKSEDDLTLLQQQARQYRNLGLEAQGIGKIDEAMSYFRKAIVMDSFYAPLYNDMGIIYEINGDTNKAEEYYFRCINMDPDYIQVYSNLALLYENKGDLKRAAHYWRKRYQMGDPNDLWTQRARRRLEDIGMVDPDVAQELREEQILSLHRDVAIQKANLKEDDKAMAQYYFECAKDKYNAEQYEAAYKDAISAMTLDPSNKDVEKFVEQIQRRILIQ